MVKKFLFIIFPSFCSSACLCQDSPKLLQRIFYEKTDTGWSVSAKENYTYDNLSKLVSTVSLDNQNGKWANHSKTEYVYPRKSNDTSRIEINYEGENNSWGPPYRSTFIKDEIGNDKSVTGEEYDSAAGKWMVRNKGEFLKNKNGNISEKRYSKPDSTGWKNEDRTLFSYNDSGLVKEEVFQEWENKNWQNHQKTVYHYNIDSTINYTEVFYTDKSSGQIKSVPDTRHVFSYDKEGNLVERRIQKLISGKWEDKFKRETIWRSLVSANKSGSTAKPVYYFNPQWSPDGKSIVFESTIDGKSSIYTISPDGNNLKKITDTIYDYGQPSWSPDGKFLVYYGSRHPMQLFIIALTGGAQKQLSTPATDAYEPSWSSKNKIAFDSRPLGQTPNDISIINSDGTGFTKITDGLHNYSSPEWSADGKQILFERSIAVWKKWQEITPEERKKMKDSGEVMIMNADGSNIRNLTRNSRFDISPSWSSDGSTIYFISETDSGRALFSMNKNGDKSKLILKLTETMGYVSISPDEKHLVYEDVRESKYAIYIWDMKKKSERKLIGD